METPATGANPGRAETSKAQAKSTASLPEKPALDTFAEQLELIAANDRQWFERHPRKRWRIRPPLPGEYPCGPQMAVRSFSPARMRFPIWGRIPLGLTDRGVELFMRAVLPPNATDLADKINGLDRSEAIPAATMQLLAEAIEGFIDPHEMAVIQEPEASERDLLLSLAASMGESQ